MLLEVVLQVDVEPAADPLGDLLRAVGVGAVLQQRDVLLGAVDQAGELLLRQALVPPAAAESACVLDLHPDLTGGGGGGSAHLALPSCRLQVSPETVATTCDLCK